MDEETTTQSENTQGVLTDTPPTSTSPIPVLPQLSVALCLLVFVFGVTYVGTSSNHLQKVTADVRVENTVASPEVAKLSLAEAFDSVQIRARSAIVWDVEKQKILFNKNADEQRPLASITKLMTALVSSELLDAEQNISITDQALKIEGDSGFQNGEVFSTQDLTDLTLISSSNDGAMALSARAGNAITTKESSADIFVHAMNIKAKELGLSKTFFKNSTGLDISETEAGAQGSARDVALLMEYIITQAKDLVENTTVTETRIASESGLYHDVRNTNTAIDNLDGLIASKTGYTTLSGGNLVVAVNIGLSRPIIVVVLGSSQEERFTDTLELLKRTKKYIENE